MAKPEGFAGDGQRSGNLVLADWRHPILIVGCGNMAGAILARWLDCGLPVDCVTVVDPARGEIAPGLAARSALPDKLARDTVVLLGIKPQGLGTLAPDLNVRLAADMHIVSMLAGVPLARLRAAFPAAGTILRIMPNLPVRAGRGVVLTAPEGGEAHPALTALLATLGLVEFLAEESLFDLATAVSGCGPAFVYRFIDALAVAGARLGLDPALAARLSAQTAAGAAHAALGAEMTPAARADAVASPGGMTREGLDVLDRDGALVDLLTETLRAAARRGEELARLSA